MTRITVSRHIPARPDSVWSALADLESHVEWMRDARSIEITSPQRQGVGTRMRVLTVFGPIRTVDVMEVTGWDEGRSIIVRHVGLVTGEGTLSVTPEGDGSLVTWDETLVFPWWLGGPIAGWMASPLLARVWRANLKQLERYLSSP